ncbi:MAG: ATP synthase [Phycisphaeraceae bacterium]|nr:MAG: ATP synthase [Phycisphaeraceae bacterium]
MSVFAPELERLRHVQSVGVVGRVAAVRGLTLLVDDLTVPVGSLVRIGQPRDTGAAMGEVVGSAGGQTAVMLLGQTFGIRARDPVTLIQTERAARVGERLLGRVIDGLGRPIDGGPPTHCRHTRALDPEPIAAMRRRRIDTQLLTGVRAVDLMTPVGRGQRLGIFAGPGVGKSTLLGQMARSTDADVSVIALIGERGREVRDFVEHALGEEGLAKSVVIAATGDESPPMRLRAAKLACAAAEHFRDAGRDVLLVMDSVTRLCHAQRQIGLSVGEPPATRGYTPSVFSEMALLLERAGTVDTQSGAGSITGMYTILVEGDDATEPISDAARGILDGHLMLSRKLAQKGHFPAIDVLDSVSRVADDVTDARHRGGRTQLARVLAAYREVEDLVQIGAYASGSDPDSDVAIEFHKPIEALLAQGRGEASRFEEAREMMIKLGLQTSEAAESLAVQRAAATRGVGQRKGA